MGGFEFVRPEQNQHLDDKIFAAFLNYSLSEAVAEQCINLQLAHSPPAITGDLGQTRLMHTLATIIRGAPRRCEPCLEARQPGFKYQKKSSAAVQLQNKQTSQPISSQRNIADRKNRTLNSGILNVNVGAHAKEPLVF